MDLTHLYGIPALESLFGNALKLKPVLREQLDIDTMARSSVQAVRLRQSLAKVASEV
jgi:predicted oxidoreductase